MARQHNSNPTGYTTAPDLGPLFSQAGTEAPRHEGTKGFTPSPAGRAGVGFSSIGNQESKIENPLPQAVEVSARHAESRRRRILQFIANNGPTTIHEFCQACSGGQVIVHAHQVSGRFSDMCNKERLLLSIGEKPHPISGCACQIYDITDAGRRELDRLKRM